MKILITGAAGFIGSSLYKKLNKKDKYEFILIDDLSKGLISNLPKNTKLIQRDISKINCYNNIENVDAIIHFAGQSSGERSFIDPIRDLNSNYISTINTLNFAKKCNCQTIVFSSSMSVYGDNNRGPLTNYGINKLAAETYLKINSENKINIFNLRLFNVYGPGQDLKDMMQGMVSIFLSQAISSNEIIVKGSLKRKRDFVYIDDVTDLVNQLLNLSVNQNNIVKTFDVASGNVYTIEQLLIEIQSLFGKKKIIQSTGTRGDQFKVKADIGEMSKILKRDTIKLENGLIKWKKSLNQ